ncbi:MAG: hypothetical protein GY895_03615 [Phycisphaera sp.]|nr:hypothetical protein [Phycisphaera sp.]
MRIDPVHLRTLILALPVLSVGLAVDSADAQRRIEPQRVNGQRTGGQLYVNPAGQALGNGSVAVPNGVLGNNAMGYGDALDSSLEVGSGGRNFRSARANAYSYQNLQARNLVVTNNVAGGRGFRGEVGYLAPGDFAGETADDSIYGFSRDSALSSLNFLSSDRAVDPFDIAQGVGVFQFRRDFTTLPEVNTISGVRQINDAEIRLDRANTAMGSRSLLATAVAPEDIGIVSAAEATMQASASTVRGVQYRAYGSELSTDLYGQALMNGDRLMGDPDAMEFPEQPFRSSATDATETAPPERITAQLNSSEAYEKILQRVYEQYEGRENVEIDGAGLQRLRRDLNRIEGQVDPTRIGDPTEERVRNTDVRREGLPGEREPLGGLDEFDEEDPADATEEETSETDTDDAEDETETDGTRSVEDLVLSLAHRTEIDTVVDPKMQARVEQVAKQAEAAMGAGDYFRAENRFDLALDLDPGNPMLEAGRANAQIGAGLYRSAAVTLTFLYRKNPEMIDVEWGAGVRPSRTRLLLAVDDLEKMIERDPDGSNGLGLLIGYIGRQLEDREVIKTGLDLIKDPRVISLVPQLRKIWLADADYGPSKTGGS